MDQLKNKELENVNGGGEPQYTGGGLTEEQKKILEETRKTFENQKEYFSKSYDGLYNNGEGWSLDPALAKDKKGPKIG